jgi:hypothetical protein
LNVIGSDTNYTAAAVNGQPAEVQYTNIALGPMSDPVQTPILVPAPPAPTETIVAAADATQETATYTFAPLLPGQGLMIDGVTVTDLVVGDSAADVADAFISGTPAPTLGISGSDTNYTVAGASSPALQDEAVFTAIASGPVGDPSESEVPVPPPSSPTGTIVAGADATPETATYTFVPLLPGQGLTIDGVTVTPLTGSDTAAEVASAFISDRGNADLSVTGSDTAYTVTAVNGQAAEAEFTANAPGPNTDPVEVVTNAV